MGWADSHDQRSRPTVMTDNTGERILNPVTPGERLSRDVPVISPSFRGSQDVAPEEIFSSSFAAAAYLEQTKFKDTGKKVT